MRTLRSFTWEPWEPVLGTLRTLGKLGNLYLGILGTFTWELWEPWEPLLGNPYLGTLGTFSWEPWERLLENVGNLENLYLEPWEVREPLLGNLAKVGALGIANLGTFIWNLYLGTLGPLLGGLAWEPWEPLLGNLGNVYVGTLGTFTWEAWEVGFGAAPVCSETFTMAEDPKASAVGEKCGQFMYGVFHRIQIRVRGFYHDAKRVE